MARAQLGAAHHSRPPKLASILHLALQAPLLTCLPKTAMVQLEQEARMHPLQDHTPARQRREQVPLVRRLQDQDPPLTQQL